MNIIPEAKDFNAKEKAFWNHLQIINSPITLYVHRDVYLQAYQSWNVNDTSYMPTTHLKWGRSLYHIICNLLI